jgi:hypothetical protein
MNHSTQDEFANGAQVATSEAERTLRLIARLPAPEGLEDRVKAEVRGRAVGGSRRARILEWPSALGPASGWMRSAAAAAIVFVVVGGGWGIYSRVQPPQGAKVIVMPPRAVSAGGFSNAGAMHVPTTLNGPIVANPAAANPVQAKTPNAKKPVRRGRAVATGTQGGQATPAK